MAVHVRYVDWLISFLVISDMDTLLHRDFLNNYQPRSQGLSLPAPQSGGRSGGRGERDPGNEVEQLLACEASVSV